MRTFLMLMTGLIFLSGCSIRQEVEPVREQPETEICIIEKPTVREGFLQTYEEVLREKGYQVRLLPQGSDLRACMLTTTYHGTWKWDLANYLGHARIEVFRDGRRVGHVEYDSRSGGANMKKFVSGRVKVRELAEQLFISRAGTGAVLPVPVPAQPETKTSASPAPKAPAASSKQVRP